MFYLRLFLSGKEGHDLLRELGVALFADLDLGAVDFLFIKALDCSSLADGAFASSVVELISDAASSMCFRHVFLLEVLIN